MMVSSHRSPSSVTDFTASDVSFAGSTVGGTLVSDVSGNGANYMVSVTGMTGNGTVLSSIPAGAAVNATSIPSAASTSIDNTVTFIAPPANADVSVTKTDSPDPVAAGGNLTYTIVVTNNGLGAAQSVVLSDAIPADTTFVLATQISGLAFTLSDPETDGTGTLTATIGTLPAGTSATFTLVVQVDSETEDGSEVTNTATVTTTTTDLNLANNSITETSIVGTEAVDECVVTTLNSPGAAGTATLGDDADNPGAGVLIVTGTSGDDVIVIGPRPGNARQIRITRNGQVIGEFSRSAMKHIVVFGLAGNDSISVATLSQPATLFGDAGNDSLTGGGGADRIDGGAGDDQLFGGSGADTLCGGDGNDFVNGQDGSDTMCGDVGNDRLIGEAGNDRLLGGDGNDGLDAGAGNDYLSGGTGTDSLAGGIGNDELRGGSGRDVLSGVAGDDLLYGGSGDDRLSGGTGNDLISGGAGDDRLNGDAGNDNISGGTGNDQINGGAGRDKLAGNGGNDTFSARDGARDTIDGGAGRDLVTADRSDTVRNVETVRRSRR